MNHDSGKGDRVMIFERIYYFFIEQGECIGFLWEADGFAR